jgi:hypothetical protein
LTREFKDKTSRSGCKIRREVVVEKVREGKEEKGKRRRRRRRKDKKKEKKRMVGGREERAV